MATKSTAKNPPEDGTKNRNEKESVKLLAMLEKYIGEKKGHYARDEHGGMSVIIGGIRVSLDPDSPCHEQNGLMVSACDVTNRSEGAKMALARLNYRALKVAGNYSFHKFAALAEDFEGLYLPLKNGRLLCVSGGEVKEVPNGDNYGKVWVEHPDRTEVNGWVWGEGGDKEAMRRGLESFERLCVNTQSCRKPELKWLVGIFEGLFPFVREACIGKFILMHRGHSQSGKTSGAQRFTKLLGLGEVNGSFSLAAARNQGDIGLFVMDNKEEKNFSTEFTDFCLTASTGSQFSRSGKDGRIRRGSKWPVIVITSIEGKWKTEVQKRVRDVEYYIDGSKTTPEDREFIKAALREEVELEIKRKRDEIFSGFVTVFQEWLRIKRGEVEGMDWYGPMNPTRPSFQNFPECWSVLGDLLLAFGRVSGKGEKWARGLVKRWYEIFSEEETFEHEMEFPLFLAFTEGETRDKRVRIDGKEGTVYSYLTVSELLHKLGERPGRYQWLPDDPETLSMRLRDTHFKRFRLVTAGEKEDNGKEIDILKRHKGGRPVGIFVADEDKEKARKGVENYVDPMG